MPENFEGIYKLGGEKTNESYFNKLVVGEESIDRCFELLEGEQKSEIRKIANECSSNESLTLKAGDQVFNYIGDELVSLNRIVVKSLGSYYKYLERFIDNGSLPEGISISDSYKSLLNKYFKYLNQNESKLLFHSLVKMGILKKRDEYNIVPTVGQSNGVSNINEYINNFFMDEGEFNQITDNCTAAAESLPFFSLVRTNSSQTKAKTTTSLPYSNGSCSVDSEDNIALNQPSNPNHDVNIWGEYKVAYISNRREKPLPCEISKGNCYKSGVWIEIRNHEKYNNIRIVPHLFCPNNPNTNVTVSFKRRQEVLFIKQFISLEFVKYVNQHGI